ncbi:MAG: hypothetical protein HY716_03390 [Planctomycetes bacterium]|nr:hypothetical protein [Planctomycetota bacterium]
MRIKGVKDGQGGLLVRLAFWLTRRKFGKVIESVRLMAHNPRVLKAAGQFQLGLEKANTLSGRLKHLVCLRTAQLIDCPF